MKINGPRIDPINGQPVKYKLDGQTIWIFKEVSKILWIKLNDYQDIYLYLAKIILIVWFDERQTKIYFQTCIFQIVFPIVGY